jgi:agmatine deiminase
VANTIVDHEPVTVVVDPTQTEFAKKYLSATVDIVEAPLMTRGRDIGPTFVVSENGVVGGVDWVFNGWGGQDWAAWGHDQHIARAVIERAGVERIGSTLVNEGGGIQVDGAGTVLVTETVSSTAGESTPDQGGRRTRTRTDARCRHGDLAAVASARLRAVRHSRPRRHRRRHADPGTVIVHDQRDPGHPDHEVSRRIRDVLNGAVTSDGSPMTIVDVPAPRVLTDDEGFVDYSYINHYVANGLVVACSFDDPSDAEAVEILSSVYPGRTVVSVDARPFFARGGGIHRITQNQPAR